MTYKTLAAAALGLVFFAFPPAHATHAAGAACSITQADVDAIRAIQNDPTLGYNAELGKELAARKGLLNRVISCAQDEVKSLKQGLQASSSGDASIKSIQSGLAGQLDDTSNYYAIEQGKVDGVGVSGSEQIARDVLAWRSDNLLPLEARIGNFVVWSKNQALFDAAATRTAQAGRVVSFLSSTDNADLASAYAAAQASFRTAQDENASAESALGQSLPADQVALLIQQSLRSLADTYRNLSDIGGIVQGLVPQGQ